MDAATVITYPGRGTAETAADRQMAYRRLALTIIGVDVQTLTAELRARRAAATLLATTRCLPPNSRAA